MSEDIKGLIEKIQQEGVVQAEEKARRIEQQAQNQARDIIDKAEAQAQRLIAEAKEKIDKMRQGANGILKQSSRDLLLVLREEINRMLEKLVASSLRQALTPEELIRILNSLTKELSAKEQVIISISKEDLGKLQSGFLSALAQDVKKGITFKSEEDIAGGFTISWDNGKSRFDFTDIALAGYLSRELKPALGEIFK